MQSPTLTDLQTVELIELTITEEDIDSSPIQSTQRGLLQQSLLQQSLVSIADPIPDQVIEATQKYSYSLQKVFSGNFSLLVRIETSENSLPLWMSLQYTEIDSFGIPANGMNLVIKGDLAFIVNSISGLQIINISNSLNLTLVASIVTNVINLPIMFLEQVLIYKGIQFLLLLGITGCSL